MSNEAKTALTMDFVGFSMGKTRPSKRKKKLGKLSNFTSQDVILASQIKYQIRSKIGDEKK